MFYEVNVNGHGYHDHLIREDGTLVTNTGSTPVLVTHINVLASSGTPSRAQCFAVFALIMQLHQELKKPVVTGSLTWDEIVAGAK